MGTIQMSTQEVGRLEVIQRVKSRQVKQSQAAKMLNISTRQIKRLLRNYRLIGAEGLTSKRRGKVSNNCISESHRLQAMKLVRAHYADFGPTLASEMLLECDGLKFSVETVRKWMIADGLWKAKNAPLAIIKPLRERRSCFGELVQADGSPHDWFEGRGPACTLLVFIDDATSRVVAARFVESETTFDYMHLARSYFEKYGKPVSLYTDKLGVFKVNHADPKSGSGLTQFGRACEELEIGLITANSPQAKGRVERVNRTFQDRLVKAMRLAGVNNAEEGNLFLPGYLEKHNRKFGVVPKFAEDAHRALTETEGELDFIFCKKHERTLSKNLEFSFNTRVYQIQTEGQGYRLRHAEVKVCELSSGVVRVFREGKELTYKTHTKQQRVAQIVSSKEVNRVVDLRLRKPYRPKEGHPWKRWNGDRVVNRVAQMAVLN